MDPNAKRSKCRVRLRAATLIDALKVGEMWDVRSVAPQSARRESMSAIGQERTSVKDRILLDPADAPASLCDASFEVELRQQAI